MLKFLSARAKPDMLRRSVIIGLLVIGRAHAGNLGISGFDHNGLLSWTNAFTSGVCTVETSTETKGPWLPTVSAFTTQSIGEISLALSPHTTFYRLQAADISAANIAGFTNLTRSYGNLRTVAGSGLGRVDGVSYWQDSFEDGFATNAALSRPHMALADILGNVFIVDKNAHAVLKVTPDARIHTIAGTHVSGNGPDAPTPATNVSLSFPNGLWLSTDGSLYILDTGNSKVRWLDTNGVLTTLFSDSNGISTGRGLWVKEDRTLVYFSDGKNLRKWTPTGGIKSVNKTNFNDLGNFVVDAQGNLIVTDRGANQVYFLPTTGANTGNATVLFGDGSTNNVVDGTPALSNGLYEVRAVWPLPTGGYFLGTDQGSQILYVDTVGVLHVFVDGQQDAHSGDGQWFFAPGVKISEVRSVTMDPLGNVLIVENDFGYVRKIDFLRLSRL